MMKLKRCVAVLTAVMLCLSLCGCAELDKMQAAHGIWVDAKTIAWNGYTYILLEGYWTDLNTGCFDSVYVTESDVPVLLSELVGDDVFVNNQGTLLSGYFDDKQLGMSGERVYCRSDLLDWMEDAFINGYEIEAYQFDYFDESAWENRVYTLSADQMQAVDTVLKTVDPFAVADYYPSGEGISLYGYSTYGLFTEEIGWIDCVDGNYYIFRENEHDGYGWNTDCYIVPDEMYDIFDSIIKAKEQDNPVADSNPTLGNNPSVFPPSVFT